MLQSHHVERILIDVETVTTVGTVALFELQLPRGPANLLAATEAQVDARVISRIPLIELKASLEQSKKSALTPSLDTTPRRPRSRPVSGGQTAWLVKPPPAPLLRDLYFPNQLQEHMAGRG